MDFPNGEVSTGCRLSGDLLYPLRGRGLQSRPIRVTIRSGASGAGVARKRNRSCWLSDDELKKIGLSKTLQAAERFNRTLSGKLQRTSILIHPAQHTTQE